jgi:hypothetical protein
MLAILIALVFIYIYIERIKSADLIIEWIEFERGVRFGNCNVSLGKGECWISTQFEAMFAIRLIGPALIKASFELRNGNMLKYVFDLSATKIRYVFDLSCTRIKHVLCIF